jgi:hypothetical protein
MRNKKIIPNEINNKHLNEKFCRRFDPGVPGPTSKLSLRVRAQMGRRDTEHKGKPVRGITASCCPAPRADALAVGGYKRS